MKRGVIYFATGARYVREAENSARSLKQHNPQLPIILFTDMPDKPAVFDQIEKVTSKYKIAFKQKCFAFGQTPFEETLFLDTDTKILGDVTPPFALLAEHDMLMAAMRWLDYSHIPPRFIDFEKPDPNRPDLKKLLNSGVIYYRMNDRVRSFLDYWLYLMRDERVPDKMHEDQEVLYYILREKGDLTRGVSIHLIPNTIYNCRDVFLPRLRREGRLGQIAIRHEHGIFDPFWVRGYWRVRKQLSNIYRRMRKLQSQKQSAD